MQIGNFYDLSDGPHLKNTAELAAFKIQAEPLPDRGMRITGWCHSSKEALKKYLKKVAHYVEPQELGEKMGLWKDTVWLPEGLKWRRQLIDFLKKEWFEGAIEVSCEGDRVALHRALGKPRVAEVVGEKAIQLSFFALPQEEMISSLQSIGKTLTILGFDHNLVDHAFVVEDGLERKRPLVEIKKISRKGAATVDLVIVAEVDQMFSLLLEKNLLMQMVGI
jgi:hypothetical protein